MLTLGIMCLCFMIGCCLLFAKFAFKAFTLSLKIAFYLAAFAGLGVIVFALLGFGLIFLI